MRNAEGRHWSRHLGRVAVGLSLALCVLLRIWSPGRIGIGQDEAHYLDVAALPSVWGVISFVYAHEPHPPLLYLTAHPCQVVGYPRINIDLTGAFISAEATPGEVVVGASGATAACLNQQIRFPVMRLNFSLLGAATAFLFDHESERMADIGSLRATPDNLNSACRTGRGVWFVAGAAWTLTGPVPLAIWRDEFGDSIRPSVASRGLASAWCHP